MTIVKITRTWVVEVPEQESRSPMDFNAIEVTKAAAICDSTTTTFQAIPASELDHKDGNDLAVWRSYRDKAQ